MSTLNLEAATRLNISQFAGHPIKVELDHFENDGITPVTLTGVFKMVVSKDELGNTPVLTLAALAVVANKLTISLTAAQTRIEPRVYQFGIRCDNGSDSYQAYYGTITIKSNPANA